MAYRLALLGILVLCQFAHLLASLQMLLAILRGSPRAWRLAIGYDQLANVSIGGSEDETISSRANRGRLQGIRKWCLLCKLLDMVEKDHCRKSAGV